MGYAQVAPLPSIYIFLNVKEGWYGVTMAEIDGRGRWGGGGGGGQQLMLGV